MMFQASIVLEPKLKFITCQTLPIDIHKEELDGLTIEELFLEIRRISLSALAVVMFCQYIKNLDLYMRHSQNFAQEFVFINMQKVDMWK